MKQNRETNHSVLFLKEWVKRPLDVAAISPSSQHLAKLISSEITNETGPVLELGPGTGVFTERLLKNGVSTDNLFLLEKSETFAKHLKEQFPKVAIVNGDASQFTHQTLGSEQKFGAAVSGMGLLSMPNDIVKSILQNIYDNMVDGGALYQFTYSWKCPIPTVLMEELNLEAQKTGRVLFNLPPATVFKITKKR